MKLEYIALWAEDIERLKNFHIDYFRAKAGDKYRNPVKRFTNCFVVLLPKFQQKSLAGT